MKKICNRKRKLPEDYHKLAQEKDFEWLGPKVFNTHTKTWWRCSKGHKWEAIYDSLRDGTGCPFCAGNKPKKPTDYCRLAEKMGLKWLGPQVSSVRDKTGWECSRGHTWEAAYSTIQQGHRCLRCSGKALKDAIDYHSLAKKCNYKWLGPFPANTRTKTKWQCEKGHVWTSTYNRIQQGCRCSYCTNRRPKTPEDYYKLAQKCDFEWLGPFPAGTGFLTWWKCEEGHNWRARYDSIKQGQGCPHCSGRAPRIFEDYCELAREKRLKWIGPLPSNTDTPSLWECSQGHQWQARYHDIKRGRNCPYCVNMINGARVSQPQRELCKMIGGELNFPHNSYRIDVALPDKKIAIDYDSWYWHGGRLEDDRRRDQELLSAGWRILHVRSNNELPTKIQLDNAIAQLQAGKSRTEIVLEDWGHGPVFTGLT